MRYFKMNKIDILFYAAAATTAIAGIIHIVLGYDSGQINTQVLFLVGGAVQIFWAVPMARKWGSVWYSVGLGGTVIFVLIWVITRVPENFITGRGGRVSDNGILTEVFQFAFVGIAIAILVLEKKSFSKKEGNLGG